jgi:hypothetical protein
MFARAIAPPGQQLLLGFAGIPLGEPGWTFDQLPVVRARH